MRLVSGLQKLPFPYQHLICRLVVECVHALLAGVEVHRLQRAAPQRKQPGVGDTGGELQVNVPQMRLKQLPR